MMGWKDTKSITRKGWREREKKHMMGWKDRKSINRKGRAFMWAHCVLSCAYKRRKLSPNKITEGN